MFSLLSRNINRVSTIPLNLRTQLFSTTANRASDLAKLILIGRLGRDPEVRTSKHDKEYVSYVVVSANTRACRPLTHSLQLPSSHNELSSPSSGSRRQYATPMCILSTPTHVSLCFFQFGQSPRPHGTTFSPSTRPRIIIFVTCRKAPTFM